MRLFLNETRYERAGGDDDLFIDFILCYNTSLETIANCNNIRCAHDPFECLASSQHLGDKSYSFITNSPDLRSPMEIILAT